ncbi:hypothetical protein [Actinomadura rubrisoli]|uniref:Uncharacterized protein n=1 Tax=Actinomadura rubrisoli TaxID=2530368 RepID=A0A4R4ZUG5_9ACTN|nr:hypothetical protein [Actinomadura rubrisoli]TDD62773.1 hypothetical protein E1298_44395 [Actinomadura rubrisoli]
MSGDDGSDPAGAQDPRLAKPYQLYQDALWDAGSDELSTTEMAVALCYANHAHKPPYDRAWLTDRRLMQQCKIRSAGTVGRIRDSLVNKGWLTPLHPATGTPLAYQQAKALQRRRKTLPYLLIRPAAPLPTAAMHTGETTAPTSGADESKAAAMSRSNGTTAPIGEADCSADRSTLSSPPCEPCSVPGSADTSQSDRELAAFTKTLMAAYGATADEVHAVLTDAEHDGIRNLTAWMNSDAGRQDIPRRLVRRRRQRAPAAAARARGNRAAIEACQWCDHNGHLDHGDLVRRCDHTDPPAPPPAGTEDHRTAAEILAELRKKWRG